MKVSFDGSYKDVQRIINAPATPREEPSDFGILLSSIAPPGSQAAEITHKDTAGAAIDSKAIAMDESARARLNIAAPELQAPLLELLSPEENQVGEAPQIVKTATPGVKTPTILSAKRINGADPFSGLSQTEKVDRVRNLVDAAGMKHGVDPALSLAMVENESSFNPIAVSSDGHSSKGLMQLLDSTGQGALRKSGSNASYKPFDPSLNIDLGVSHLRHLHDLFSQASDLPGKLATVPAANSASLEELAVAAFNAGEGRVASAQERAKQDGKNPGVYEEIADYLPESTQEYVKRVAAARARYGGDPIG